MRLSTHRWHKIAAATAFGVLIVPAAVSAQEGPSAGSFADQMADATITLDQTSWSNSGGNVQDNTTGQSNGTGQESNGWADGGSADSGDGSGTASGGVGGTADATNDGASTNGAGGANGITSGDAAADNAVGGGVTQSQDIMDMNTAEDSADDMMVEESEDTGSGATVGSEATQHASTSITVSQDAWANSGNNVQDNSTSQSNGTGQSSNSTGNGGSANSTGGSGTSTGGAGGSASAGNTSTSGNTSSGGNTISTGAASSSNTATFTVSQSSTNSSTNSVTTTP